MTIRPITYKDAKAFCDRVHRHHHASQGCKFCVQILGDEGQTVGVAMCGRPVARRLDDGLTLEINRVATDGTRNACSMLYGACVRIARDMGYGKVITYTLMSESGASLRASGFTDEGEAGGTHWTGSRDKGQDIPREMKRRWSLDTGR